MLFPQPSTFDLTDTHSCADKRSLQRRLNFQNKKQVCAELERLGLSEIDSRGDNHRSITEARRLRQMYIKPFQFTVAKTVNLNIRSAGLWNSDTANLKETCNDSLISVEASRVLESTTSLLESCAR